MLQVMLCAICMMSAALLYYDFVIIPRQNRELVEDLKSHFPEVFPPRTFSLFTAYDIVLSFSVTVSCILPSGDFSTRLSVSLQAERRLVIPRI